MNNEPKKSSNVAAILWLVFFFPIGLYVMWAKTNWNKKVKWGITGFFAFLVLVSSIGNSNSKTTTSTDSKSTSSQVATVTPQPKSTPVPTITPSPKPVPKDANGFPMDAEAVTVENLDKAPSQYDGKKITFTCSVIGFAKDDSGNATAVNCSDLNDFTSVVQVDTSLFDMTKINKDDTVRFYGLGTGSATGKNAYGGDISESLVMAAYINDLTSGYKE